MGLKRKGCDSFNVLSRIFVFAVVFIDNRWTKSQLSGVDVIGKGEGEICYYGFFCYNWHWAEMK